MYPEMFNRLKHAYFHGDRNGFEGRAQCAAGGGGPGGPGGGRHGGGDGHHGHGRGWGRGGLGRGFGEEGFGGHEHDGGFGVRRPLRFLAYRLELEEAQVEDLASILNDLKTERAQGDVDQRRSTSAIAEAIAGAELDASKLAAATEERVKSAERLRDAVVKAISRIHKLLTPDQRTRFAYLIRTGALSI